MMAKPWERHEQIIVETYDAIKPNKSSRRHVRPIKGEKHPASMDVRFPRKTREKYAEGTKFRIYAKLTDKQGGKDFLSTHHSWPFEVWDDEKQDWVLIVD